MLKASRHRPAFSYASGVFLLSNKWFLVRKKMWLLFFLQTFFFQNLKKQQTTFHPLDKANWLKYPGLIKIYSSINGCQVGFGQKLVLKLIQKNAVTPFHRFSNRQLTRTTKQWLNHSYSLLHGFLSDVLPFCYPLDPPGRIKWGR